MSYYNVFGQNYFDDEIQENSLGLIPNILSFDNPNDIEDDISKQNYTKEEDRLNNEQYIGEIEEKKLNDKSLIIANSKLRTNVDSNKKQTIFNIIKKVKKKLLGRKRKSETFSHFHQRHDKYYKDNMTRKLKSKLFSSILTILNNSLKENQIKNNYKKLKKYNYSKEFLLKVNKEITTEIGVIKNRKLLYSKIKDIFSSDVNHKYKKFGLDYNKKFIEKIYSENTKTKTIAILEKTLIDCLNHFSGNKYFEELDGLEKEYENFINEMKYNGEEEEYINRFKNFVNTFEEYYQNKKPRKEIIIK